MFHDSFSHRGPDFITEELALVLSVKGSLEFKPLFDLVHANLRALNYFSEGEDMLRMRTYDKLQILVDRGMVRKTITKGVKEYRGLASLATELPHAASSPG